jgi:hypothetical protein
MLQGQTSKLFILFIPKKETRFPLCVILTQETKQQLTMGKVTGQCQVE